MGALHTGVGERNNIRYYRFFSVKIKTRIERGVFILFFAFFFF